MIPGDKWRHWVWQWGCSCTFLQGNRWIWPQCDITIVCSDIFILYQKCICLQYTHKNDDWFYFFDFCLYVCCTENYTIYEWENGYNKYQSVIALSKVINISVNLGKYSVRLLSTREYGVYLFFTERRIGFGSFIISQHKPNIFWYPGIPTVLLCANNNGSVISWGRKSK